MVRLEDLTIGTRIKWLAASDTATIESVSWIGQQGQKVILRDYEGGWLTGSPLRMMKPHWNWWKLAAPIGVTKQKNYRWIDLSAFIAHQVGSLLRFMLSEVDETVILSGENDSPLSSNGRTSRLKIRSADGNSGYKGKGVV